MSSPYGSAGQEYDAIMPIRFHHQAARRAGTPIVAVLLAVVSISTLGGCQRSLFPKKAPRTQFETYDLMRQRYVPLEAPDVFGEPKPALRARLGPR